MREIRQAKDARSAAALALRLWPKHDPEARAQGCAEFASDCELDNTESLRFHLAVGFTEADRIICFTKKL